MLRIHFKRDLELHTHTHARARAHSHTHMRHRHRRFPPTAVALEPLMKQHPLVEGRCRPSVFNIAQVHAVCNKTRPHSSSPRVFPAYCDPFRHAALLHPPTFCRGPRSSDVDTTLNIQWRPDAGAIGKVGGGCGLWGVSRPDRGQRGRLRGAEASTQKAPFAERGLFNSFAHYG